MNTLPEKKKEQFYKAWNYLYNHKKFKDNYGNEGFLQALDIDVVKVNSKTQKIEDDKKKNTEVQIWLECGAHYKLDTNTGKEGWYYDSRLDCGGDTFEEAIIKLATLVRRFL